MRFESWGCGMRGYDGCARGQGVAIDEHILVGGAASFGSDYVREI